MVKVETRRIIYVGLENKCVIIVLRDVMIETRHEEQAVRDNNEIKELRAFLGSRPVKE